MRWTLCLWVLPKSKKNYKFTSFIDEPLVVQAGFNYFEKKSNDMWFQLMSQVNCNAAMQGLIWGVFCKFFAKLFEINTDLSESKMFIVKGQKGKIIDYKYLPEDFERPLQLLPYGDKCVGHFYP